MIPGLPHYAATPAGKLPDAYLVTDAGVTPISRLVDAAVAPLPFTPPPQTVEVLAAFDSFGRSPDSPATKPARLAALAASIAGVSRHFFDFENIGRAVRETKAALDASPDIQRARRRVQEI
jgi:hypothetical protein